MKCTPNWREYTYDSSNKLLSAKNYDGYTISYQYFTTAPYRVKKVAESHTNGTLGGELNMSYGYNTTFFTDVKGRKETYQFNDSGNTISVKDANGSAEYYNFGSGVNANNLAAASKLQNTVINLLKNHNIELSGYWNGDYWTGSTGTNSVTTEDKYLGNQSLKVNKTNTLSRHFFNQSIDLQKGKTYTFSGYVKTNNISGTNNKGAALFVNYLDGSGNWQTVESKYVNGTKGFERQEVSFTLPANSVSTTVYARAGIIEETGTAYFDSLQLEEGSIANRYNLIENASFEFDTGIPLFWGRSGSSDANDTSVSSESVFGSRSVRLNGVANQSKNFYQTINVSGQANDVFVVSGWGKGSSVPLKSGGGRYFALDVGIHKTDGSYQWEVVPFNEDSTDWQYASGKVIASGPYTDITFYVLYYNEANTAYFDGLQLYKEEFGQSYTRDSNGNVISSVDLAKQQSSFEYSGNDLTKATDPKGSQFNYTYDTKHNVLSGTSAMNVVYSFTYDSNGNPLTGKVADTGNSLFTQTSTSYTSSGNYVTSLTDSRGNTVTNNWDETKGLLSSTVDAKRNYTNYTYDPNTDQISTVTKNVGATNVEEFTFANTSSGSKGTTTISENAYYETDSAGTAYLSSYESSTNLMQSNTSFESGTSGWILDDWSLLSGASRIVTDAPSGTGTKSLEFYDSDGLTDGSTTNPVASQYVTFSSPISAATTYTISAYAKRIGSTQPMISVIAYDVNWNEMPGSYQSYAFGINENQWTRVSHSFTMPVGTKNMRVIVRAQVKDSDKVRFDAVQAEQKPYATPYASGTRVGTNALYNLGINKKSGTMSLWFNANSLGGGTTRQLISSETVSSLLDVYINTDNKLYLGVRNSSGTWTVPVSADTVIFDQPNFMALTWSTSGSVLTCNLWLNGTKYTGTQNGFKDFSGATTFIGSNIQKLYQLNGAINQFYYSPNVLSDTDITALYNKTYTINPGTAVTNSYTYENDKLETVTHNGFSYSFGYDSLSNNTTVAVGSQNLITNTYETVNVGGVNRLTGRLESSTYGNGQVVKNNYDSLDRLIGKEVGNQSGTSLKYSYQYAGNGNIGYQKDDVNSVNYKYIYDAANRLVKIVDSNNNSLKYDYDNNNNTSSVTDIISGIAHQTTFQYDNDNRPTAVLYGNNRLDNTYDAIGRLDHRIINTGTYNYRTNFAYLPGINGSASTTVSSIVNDSTNGGGSTISFTYDANGNIETITQGGSVIKYYYNELNELIREDNQVLNKTITQSRRESPYFI